MQDLVREGNHFNLCAHESIPHMHLAPNAIPFSVIVSTVLSEPLFQSIFHIAMEQYDTFKNTKDARNGIGTTGKWKTFQEKIEN